MNKPKKKQSKKDEAQHAMQELEAQSAEFEAGWKRALADYQNLQKETQERIQSFAQMAGEEFVQDLLPIVDNFGAAFRALDEDLENEPWVQGMQHIHRQFEEFLERRNVEKIPTIGEQFDPTRHEAVEEVEGGTSGEIVEEVQSGYEMNGKVIRPARVKTAK